MGFKRMFWENKNKEMHNRKGRTKDLDLSCFMTIYSRNAAMPVMLRTTDGAGSEETFG